MKDLGYDNVTVRIGDGYKGWPEKAPFDAIVVTAAPPEIPQALIDQLAEGGRMVVPVGTAFQELLLIEKKKGEITKRVITAVRFVPMVKGKAGPDKNVARHYPAAFDSPRRTVTTVWIPPRTKKSPTTSMKRGLVAAAMSSRIWLVTASWNAPSLRYDHK